ncbi:TPA: hypothetical protein ACH3X1_010944 [Trebouxia sp. C0004]
MYSFKTFITHVCSCESRASTFVPVDKVLCKFTGFQVTFQVTFKLIATCDARGHAVFLKTEAADHNDCGRDRSQCVQSHSSDRPLKTLSVATNNQTGKEAPSSWLVGVSAVHSPSASGD